MNTGAEIDSASFRQIAQLYDRPIDQIYPWSWKTAVEVTKLLIFCSDNISLAPGPAVPPDAHAIDGNPYQIEFRLADSKILPVSPIRELDSIIRDAGNAATANWLGNKENPVRENFTWLIEAATAVQNDEENGKLWLDWVWHRVQYVHQSTAGLFRVDYLGSMQQSLVSVKRSCIVFIR